MTEKEAKRWKIFINASITLSLVWVFAWLLVACYSTPPLWKLELNEAGDFWAGLAAPLAFYCLALGFFQQGRELKLQIEEMRNSVAQFAAQTAIFEKQLKASDRDQIRIEFERDVLFVKEELFAALRPCFVPKRQLKNPIGGGIGWEIPNTDYDSLASSSLTTFCSTMAAAFQSVKKFGKFPDLASLWGASWSQTRGKLGELADFTFALEAKVLAANNPTDSARFYSSGLIELLGELQHHFDFSVSEQDDGLEESF